MVWNSDYLRLLELRAASTRDEGEAIRLAWQHYDWMIYEIERWGEIVRRVYPERCLTANVY